MDPKRATLKHFSLNDSTSSDVLRSFCIFKLLKKKSKVVKDLFIVLLILTVKTVLIYNSHLHTSLFKSEVLNILGSTTVVTVRTVQLCHCTMRVASRIQHKLVWLCSNWKTNQKRPFFFSIRLPGKNNKNLLTGLLSSDLSNQPLWIPEDCWCSFNNQSSIFCCCWS